MKAGESSHPIPPRKPKSKEVKVFEEKNLEVALYLEKMHQKYSECFLADDLVYNISKPIETYYKCVHKSMDPY